jgi:hypothetical protein
MGNPSGKAKSAALKKELPKLAGEVLGVLVKSVRCGGLPPGSVPSVHCGWLSFENREFRTELTTTKAQ